MSAKRPSPFILPFGLVFAMLGGCRSGGVEVGSSGLEVTASLSSVSLADDCPSNQGDSAAGACLGDGPCKESCQQSGLQIDLVAGEGTTPPVDFAIVAVRVLDHDSHQQVAVPVTRDGQRWTQSGYVTWDERIAPRDRLKVSYEMSSPNLPVDSRLAAAKTYLVEVDVLIDGVPRTISLDGVTREPIVAT